MVPPRAAASCALIKALYFKQYRYSAYNLEPSFKAGEVDLGKYWLMLAG